MRRKLDCVGEALGGLGFTTAVVGVMFHSCGMVSLGIQHWIFAGIMIAVAFVISK